MSFWIVSNDVVINHFHGMVFVLFVLEAFVFVPESRVSGMGEADVKNISN